jgi:hypothetical protein
VGVDEPFMPIRIINGAIINRYIKLVVLLSSRSETENAFIKK